LQTNSKAVAVKVLVASKAKTALSRYTLNKVTNAYSIIIKAVSDIILGGCSSYLLNINTHTFDQSYSLCLLLFMSSSDFYIFMFLT